MNPHRPKRSSSKFDVQVALVPGSALAPVLVLELALESVPALALESVPVLAPVLASAQGHPQA